MAPMQEQGSPFLLQKDAMAPAGKEKGHSKIRKCRLGGGYRGKDRMLGSCPTGTGKGTFRANADSGRSYAHSYGEIIRAGNRGKTLSRRIKMRVRIDRSYGESQKIKEAPAQRRR